MVEYMLLLMTVVTLVVIAFNRYLPTRVQDAANIYYNRAVPAILGPPPRCGDGTCSPCPFESCGKCPTDCGVCGAFPPPC